MGEREMTAIAAPFAANQSEHSQIFISLPSS